MNRPHNPDSGPNTFPDPDATWNPPEIIPPTDGDKPLPLPSPPSGGKPPAPARHGSNLTLPYDQSHDRMGLAHDSKDSDGVTPGPAESHDAEDSKEWDSLPPPEFRPGATVFDKYHLIKMLGEGGMGQVWLVDNIKLERKCALKLIRPEIAKNEKAWRRFKREARVMAKLKHPNAIAVYDFNRSQSVAYIEMEYVKGDSLDNILAEQNGKPMPIEWVVSVLDQLCEVLQEAHDYVDEDSGKPRPIIHRDLKPSNMMLLSKGTGKTLKVLDFGIAKMADDDREAHLTGDAEFLGTASYSSPEQIRGDPVDGRSDVYSVGVMLYQFLTGMLPFRGGAKRSLVAHLTEAPKPLTESNPTVVISAAVERLVLQCLEKDPERRPRSARELAERFREAVGHQAKAVVKAKLPRKPLPLALIGSLAVMISAIITAGVIAWKITPPPQLTLNPYPAKPVIPPNPPNPPDVKGKDWEPPQGFKVVAAEGQASDGPKVLERIADGVKFARFSQGIYLPFGYKPEDPDQQTDGWPRVLVHNTAGLRFIRIPGGVFEQGDYESGADREPASDRMENPLVKHWVELSGYYIQDTEVTNSHVEAYLKEHPGEIPETAMGDWREYLRILSKTDRAGKWVRMYPAVLLDLETARGIASGFGALLPTESQWEFAARSGGLPKPFATKLPVPAGGKPFANIRGGEAELDPYPMPVMSYKDGKDETQQGVFDMTGNARERCRDGYRSYLSLVKEMTSPEDKLRDPFSPAVASADDNTLKGVVRGGSFQRIADEALTYQREAEEASNREIDLGFRLVIECPPRLKPSP